jgi:hypothetical protein
MLPVKPISFVNLCKTVVLSAVGFLGAIGVAYSQTPPSQIEEPSVDMFGVERKTGLIGFTSPLIMSIGGSGPQSLNLYYRHIDGVDLAPALLPRLQSDSYYDSQDRKYYITRSIQYEGISETFRRETHPNNSPNYTPSFPSGSTLVEQIFSIRINFS